MNDTLAAYVMIVLLLVPALFAVHHLHIRFVAALDESMPSLPVTPKEK